MLDFFSFFFMKYTCLIGIPPPGSIKTFQQTALRLDIILHTYIHNNIVTGSVYIHNIVYIYISNETNTDYVTVLYKTLCDCVEK